MDNCATRQRNRRGRVAPAHSKVNWLHYARKFRNYAGQFKNCAARLKNCAPDSRKHTSESVRIDKWLWAVRLYKSRSLAAEACHAGHVKIGGYSVKPSRDVRAGEEITVFAGRLLRTVKVLALLDQRVGAKLVSQFLEDLTPPEAYARAREKARVRFSTGIGRPTKKQRRQLERFF